MQILLILCIENESLHGLLFHYSAPSSEQSLPRHESDKQLAKDFGSFFYNKIQKIVDKLDSRKTDCETMRQENVHASFAEFHLVSEDDVIKVIKESPSKSCRLDPAPTWFLKRCLDVLIPFITKLVNLSLSSGVFPSLFKISHVTPVLKKPQLDVENFANYRPIANQMFLAKVLERIAANQLRGYLQDSQLFPPMQSAYRGGHSTGTALLKVYNDILIALDKGQEVILVLLDYSAAFDTIDHETMNSTLQSQIRHRRYCSRMAKVIPREPEANCCRKRGGIRRIPFNLGGTARLGHGTLRICFIYWPFE